MKSSIAGTEDQVRSRRLDQLRKRILAEKRMENERLRKKTPTNRVKVTTASVAAMNSNGTGTLSKAEKRALAAQRADEYLRQHLAERATMFYTDEDDFGRVMAITTTTTTTTPVKRTVIISEKGTLTTRSTDSYRRKSVTARVCDHNDHEDYDDEYDDHEAEENEYYEQHVVPSNYDKRNLTKAEKRALAAQRADEYIREHFPTQVSNSADDDDDDEFEVNHEEDDENYHETQVDYSYERTTLVEGGTGTVVEKVKKFSVAGYIVSLGIFFLALWFAAVLPEAPDPSKWIESLLNQFATIQG